MASLRTALTSCQAGHPRKRQEKEAQKGTRTPQLQRPLWAMVEGGVSADQLRTLEQIPLLS